MKPGIGVVIPRELRDQILSPDDQARLNGLGDVRWTDEPESLTEKQACGLLADCRVGVGSWGTPYPTEALLNACPRLELWEHVAGSVKHMFGPHLKGRRLTIASCAPAIAASVAQYTVGAVITGLKRVFENAAANRGGIAGRPPHTKAVHGATVGLVGASLVGRETIRLLRPFGCRTLLYDPHVGAAEARELGVTLVADLTELCAASDVVSLHAPALPSTKHMLGAAQFGAMRDDAVFVNTARGMCVDEAALIAELDKGRLFAILDVTDPEPAAPDSPLRRLPNVVLTSHMAGTPDWLMGRQAVDDIAAFLAGGIPARVVTEEMLERIA